MGVLRKLGRQLGILKRHMPPAVARIDQVLENLNTNYNDQPGTTPWVALNEYQTMTTVQLGPQIGFNPTRGVIVKNFVNTRTGEVRSFLVKLLDVPEREYLA